MGIFEIKNYGLVNSFFIKVFFGAFGEAKNFLRRNLRRKTSYFAYTKSKLSTDFATYQQLFFGKKNKSHKSLFLKTYFVE